MAEYINVKIIGVDPVSAGSNVIARSATGGGASGQGWQLLNVHSLGNIFVHSASGVIPAAFIKTSASAQSTALAGGTLIGAYGQNSASGTALSAAGFWSVVDDAGVQWAIPLMKPS